ncbi:hypothetical protein [Microcoleus sp. CAWBG58]|uniref:hypothetical protein n=1 Tax=Microcoleus sp. CAWBG58 TaxID=2841651 RepID=UPI0025E38E68|nr:hypothetical protein [Microcoleus sp. CAWBG58]
MPVQTAKRLLEDSRTTVGELLDVLSLLTRHILHLRVRERCAQGTGYLTNISDEIRQSETTIEQVRKRIEEKCTD